MIPNLRIKDKEARNGNPLPNTTSRLKIICKPPAHDNSHNSSIIESGDLLAKIDSTPNNLRDQKLSPDITQRV